nr:PAS domain-containing hybrid sensor histidine kinase/response regulator [uncultured Dongia sp.]
MQDQLISRVDNDEVVKLRREVSKLREINRALTQHVEHSLDLQGNAYHLFQTAILLDRMVKERTRELEHALEAVAGTNRELNEAVAMGMTAQNRQRDAINSISEGFAIFDPADQLILCNQRFLDFWPNLKGDIHTDMTFEALIRLALKNGSIVTPADCPVEQWIADRLAQRKEIKHGGINRWVYALSNGRWIQVNDRPSLEGGIASVYTDITDVKDAERQEREQALAERSRHLQATLESMSIGVAVFDQEQRLMTVNQRYGELLELPPNLLAVGATLYAFQRFNDLRNVPELGVSSPIVTTHSTTPAEVSVNGRWFAIKRDPMPDGGFVLSCAEITERRLAEEAVHDREERIRLFANAMPTMMCFIDEQEQYQFVNRAYRTSFGRNGKKILGRRMRAVLGEEEYNLRRPYIERVLSGSTVVFELALPSADGEPRFGLATYVPHRDSNGRVIGFFTLVQDITERRRAQRILEAANEELERRVHERTASLQQLNETLLGEVVERRRIAAELQLAKIQADRANLSKTQFLADASHDLLQPLNAARLFVAAIQDQSVPEDLLRLISRVDRALSNVEDILNILLDISKLDAGKVAVNIRRAPLVALMAALFEEIAPLAKRNGLTVTLMPCSLSVKTDVPLLRRLLQNFLTNACRYAPNGRILFGARRRGTFVELQVLDNGIGIPKDKLNEIFEEFRRLTEIGGEGYGLGLSIVRRISRLINCPVQVRSKLGKGSMFSVLVPVATDFSEPVDVGPPAVTERASVEGVHVVVVENEPDVLDGMAGLLNAWRCDVIAAPDQSRALAEISRRGICPDIILADFHLDRGRVGTDVIAAIRKQCNAAIPAAVITADRNPEIQHLAQQLGATLLVKPIKPARLRALISSVRR